MSGRIVESNIPARLDRLAWSRWHWRIVIALGITWVLDGLEVTLAGAIAAVLTRHDTLGLTPARVGASATAYLFGAVVGALVFGYSTDRMGRKKLFTVTLLLYLCSTILTAFSWSFASYALFRALTGAGIGGEYAAINSAIDELIPARVRGRVDLIINGSFWVGAAMGSLATVLLLDTNLIPVNLGWRLAFGIGGVLGSIIIFLRHAVPESPRWLMIHGREEEAERIVSEVESATRQPHADNLSAAEGLIRIHSRTHTTWSEIWQAMAIDHRRRSLLGLALMIAQHFSITRFSLPTRWCWSRSTICPSSAWAFIFFPLQWGIFWGP
jgi:MFS family permease